MPAPVFLVGDSNFVAKVGRVGLDFDAVDTTTGSSYNTVIKTGAVSPAGESGLCLFKQIALRVFHSSPFTVTAKVYVDGEQTKKNVATTTQYLSYEDRTKNYTAQETTVSVPEPADFKETILLFDVEAVGTYIQLELSISSSSLKSPIMLESAVVHYILVRTSKLES